MRVSKLALKTMSKTLSFVDTMRKQVHIKVECCRLFEMKDSSKALELSSLISHQFRLGDKVAHMMAALLLV